MKVIIVLTIVILILNIVHMYVETETSSDTGIFILLFVVSTVIFYTLYCSDTELCEF
jgi:hypothetical protein